MSKGLAEQILSNPLFEKIMDQLESDAIERLVSAKTDLERLECQMRVQATRAFREECEARLRIDRSE